MEQREAKPHTQYKMDAVLNLSSKELTADERRELASPTLRKLPIKEIIIGVETLIKTANIPTETAMDLRNTTIREIDRMERLEKKKPTKPNLTKQEWSAVKTLAADTERRIVKGDKGDKSIVMDYGLQSTSTGQRQRDNNSYE